LGIVTTGSPTAASVYEQIGLATAEFTDVASQRIGTMLAVNNKEFKENRDMVIQQWINSQTFRAQNHQRIQRIEEVFGRDNLHAMGITTSQINSLDNSLIREICGIRGYIKEYSQSSFTRDNGLVGHVERYVFEERGNDMVITTTKTRTSGHYSFNGTKANQLIELQMENRHNTGGVDMSMTLEDDNLAKDESLDEKRQTYLNKIK